MISLESLGRERRKCEADSENDREPDPPHGHLRVHGWRESSRRRLIAGAGPAGRAWVYSMTSSASSSNDGGIVSPSALAVLRLFTMRALNVPTSLRAPASRPDAPKA